MLSLQRLQRVTTQNIILKEIDGLRFIAIFFVVFSHIRTVFFSETGFNVSVPLLHGITDIISGDNGINGVRIFFGVSGFILAYPFFIQGVTFNFKDYFARRISRLEPPYIISLIIYFFAMVAIKGKLLFISLAFSVFYLHSFVFQKPSEINPITWSLEVEVQYYLLFPLLLYSFKQLNKRSRFLSYGLIILVICFGVYNQNISILPYKSLLSEIQYFLTGFLAANLIQKRGMSLEKASPALVSLLLIAIVILLYVIRVSDNSVFNQVVFVLLNFALFRLVLIPSSLFRKLLSRNFFYLTGGMCYTIYLYHIASLVLITPYIGNVFKPDFAGFFFFTLTGFVLIWLSSYVLYIFFEKPFMIKKWYNDSFFALKNYYKELFSKKYVINQ